MYFVVERPKKAAVNPIPQTVNERTFFRKPPPPAKRKLDMVMATDTMAGTSTDTARETAEDPKTADEKPKKKKPIDVTGTYKPLFLVFINLNEIKAGVSLRVSLGAFSEVRAFVSLECIACSSEAREVVQALLEREEGKEDDKGKKDKGEECKGEPKEEKN